MCLHLAIIPAVAAVSRAHLAKLLTGKRHQTTIKPRKQMDIIPFCRKFSAGYTGLLSSFSSRVRGRWEARVTLSQEKEYGKGDPAVAEVQPTHVTPFLPLLSLNGEVMLPSISPPGVSLVKTWEDSVKQPLLLQRRSSVH